MEVKQRREGVKNSEIIWFRVQGTLPLSSSSAIPCFPLSLSPLLPARGTLKIIDLGAAADLRVGINYNPSEFLLDPR